MAAPLYLRDFSNRPPLGGYEQPAEPAPAFECEWCLKTENEHPVIKGVCVDCVEERWIACVWCETLVFENDVVQAEDGTRLCCEECRDGYEQECRWDAQNDAELRADYRASVL